ncbi:hypothetical protein [Nostoc commune]|uniref:hypothetical protein n=1 Tax=Nostoc commune TaxID=1178 RepID=UPI0018C857A7|nr:hypothetical protein [Nostoc commune]
MPRLSFLAILLASLYLLIFALPESQLSPGIGLSLFQLIAPVIPGDNYFAPYLVYNFAPLQIQSPVRVSMGNNRTDANSARLKPPFRTLTVTDQQKADRVVHKN